MQNYVWLRRFAFVALFLWSGHVQAHGFDAKLLGIMFDSRALQSNVIIAPRFSLRSAFHEIDILIQYQFGSGSGNSDVFGIVGDYGYVIKDWDVSKTFNIGLELHLEVEYLFTGFNPAAALTHSLETCFGLVGFVQFVPNQWFRLISKVIVSWAPQYFRVGVEDAIHFQRLAIVSRTSLFVQMHKRFYLVPGLLYRIVVGNPNEQFLSISISALYAF